MHLRKLGPVTPFPTHSNTSTFNHAVFDATSHGAVPAHGSGSTATAINQTIQRTNPALVVIEARERFARKAEEERDGYVDADGRRFVSVGMLRDIVALRGKIDEDGVEGGNDDSKDHALNFRTEEDGQIEKRFGLKRGALDKLGKRGVVEGV